MLFGFSFVHLALQPKSFSWHVDLRSYSKDPFGTFVFFEQLPSLFEPYKVKRLRSQDLDTYAMPSKPLDSLEAILNDTAYQTGR
jgi:hypothetical protein